jgi:hypothetical protein
MTHINAFAAEAVKAREEVVQALGRFDAAVEQLKGHSDFAPSLLVRLPFEVLWPKPEVEVKPVAKAPEAKA